MTRRAFRALRPSRSDALATTVQLFLAIRAGDVGRVKALLDAAPSLVGAHENWSGEEAEGAGIPYAASATPLVRAVERDQQEVVTLLLERGADANGACGCAGGEAPLWSAVVHARPRLVVTLLDGGADPNRPAFRGQRPLHVAASRGYAEIVDTLLARGADPALTDDEGRTARDWAEVNGHPSVCLRLGETAKAARVNLRRPAQLRADRWETGIRALDLLCPLPRHGIARWEGGPGVGSMVLLIEIVARFAPVVDGVVWGGIEPSPGDRNDLVQDLREQGADAEVDVLLASRDCSPQARRDLLRVAADRAYAHAARGGALLILQSERGLQSDVEAVLPAIDREAGGPLTTIVIAPPTQPDPVPGLHRPYVSLAAFDLERAKVGQWPALDLSRSTTSLHLSAEHRRVLGDLRAAIDAGSSAGRACGWYLAQPFYTTEPFSSLPGEWTPVDDTIRKLARIIEEAPGADRTD